MAATADIFTEREDWRRPLGWSAALHGLLFCAILLYGAIFGRFTGESWGGSGSGGGAMSATLVSTIPLPHAAPQSQNILANESKGLSQSLPKVKEEPTPEAIPIPEKSTKRRVEPKPKPRTSTQEKPRPVEEASNVVPFGQGGPVSGPYGVFSTPNAKGGFGFNGGGGDFGSRFAWYVRVVQQKISENWLKYEIDPNIHDARRVYITFEITRTGQPTSVQVEQSSGVPSLDQSAVRALQRIDSFGPLPNEYAGNRVSVEFWFDYRR
ncbi:MAG: TonB family protein [Acidobacteriia bacterium]|nr:TonB family protein [Terriglobia bacterium]